MKRLSIGLGIALLLALPILAQDSADIYESEHYRIRSFLGLEHAEELATQLEALAVLYNDYFHFDMDSLEHKLRVQVFSSRDEFDRYLTRLIGETRDEFVYLHYSDVTRSELVGFADLENPYDSSIAHQGFIQFLRSFVANPPLWIREGFAVYFENAEFDPNFNAAINKENLSWLETLKDILFGARSSEALTPEQVLALDVQTAREHINVFYPEAWAVVNYLINSPVRSHNRILWDSIAALKASADLEENSAKVLEAAFRWVPQGDLLDSFVAYFAEKKTYAELITAGVEAYEAARPDQAESYFVQAIDRQDTSFVPHYYLGLINYDRGNYALAQYNYEVALDMGAEPALTYYALGVNAFADSRFDEAEEFLLATAELDPNAFGDKVGLILDRLAY